MDTIENARSRAEYWKAEHRAANAEIERLRTLANEAYGAWQNDKDMLTGKLLRMMNEHDLRTDQ